MQVLEDDKTKTQCIIPLVDSILQDLEIVYLQEEMCKAEAEQTWYLVHKEHEEVIPELKIL